MKWKDLVMLGGISKDEAKELWLSEPSGTYSDNSSSWISYGSASLYDIEWYDEPVIKGHRHIQEGEELWKCEGCGKVYRVKDTLECLGCGHPITEKSRFVLE